MTMGMALGDGLLQEVWFSDSSEDEGSPGRARWTRPRLPKLPWQENLLSSAVMCALSQLIYIFILKT